MSRIDQVVDQLKRAFDGEAWHGPALMEVLDGIDASTAAGHPISGAHSIWELVIHIAGWERVAITRIVSGKTATLTDEQNFGPIAETTEENWRKAIQHLRDTHSELIRIVSALPETRVKDTTPSKDYDLQFMLLGTVQHAAYHAGQIAVLKRAKS